MAEMNRYIHIVVLATLLCSFHVVPARASRVVERVFYYTSLTPQGDTVTLSGKISAPFGKTAKGVILIPHFTIAGNDEVPSTSTIPESKHFRDEYVLIMPDYLGYGVTRDRVHPYLRGDLVARHCVDMLMQASDSALFNLCADARTNLPQAPLYIVGFSEGAATALWTLRLLEQEYPQVKIAACYAGSGPYDVATTYDDAVAKNKVGMPLAIPMLVMGTSEAYGLNLQRSDFFTPEMDRCYDAYITSKEYSYVTLYFLMTSRKVSRWLSASGMNKRQPETRRMYEGFLRSSLVHFPLPDDVYYDDPSALGKDTILPDWQPRTPLYIFHSYDDDIVCYSNCAHLQKCWSNLPNVTFETGHFGGHMRSIFAFMKRVKKKL